MDWIFGIAAIIHIYFCPFTKVEESFNIQACHDILYFNTNISQYDHLEFPGVVPRTFVGPLILSVISFPFVHLIRVFDYSKFYSQYVVRFVLGLLVFLAWREFRKQIQTTFGKPLGIWFTLICASQFHFVYYLSRTLPNIFALIFALLAYKHELQQNYLRFLIYSGIGVIIFRFELSLLLGPILLYNLFTRRLTVKRLLSNGIPTGLICLCCTVFIDSIFWKRLTWPEGEVLWFNTYENQSHHWGTYPFLWYWYSCLPRALGLSLLLVPVGVLVDQRIMTLVIPGFLFIALYSFLPHKELRFIIYALPLFNVAAARGCQFFWDRLNKSFWMKSLAVASLLHIIGNVLFTSLLLTVSTNNYPGGSAILKLHDLVSANREVNLHVDNLAAQTGVTRFTELNSNWSYNKTENLKPGSSDLLSFTHLLVEAKSKYAYNLKHYADSHRILGSVESFSHIGFNYFSFPPIKVRLKPAMFILEKLDQNRVEGK